jgi:catechol 2,3-dioxygenase-like lactoylglutathione lyase family enzyme
LKRLIALLSIAVLTPCLLPAQSIPRRPIIDGISHFSVYAADPVASRRFYTGELGFTEGPANIPGQADYFASAKQYVSVSQLPAEHTTSRLNAVYFSTTNAKQLRLYLAAKGIAVPTHLDRDREGSLSFQVLDPDGNHIGFEQLSKRHTIKLINNPTSTRIIHVGFAVHDRATEEHFFRQILGFRPYWHGGMKDGLEEFVSLQVPNGTDWIEFMLTVPKNPSQQALGVLDHFSLGVVDINGAAARLEEHGWHETPGEHRQDGRDGKRQLNVYDPDLTRVEFMEFKPFRAPCCSPFTGPHPEP